MFRPAAAAERNKKKLDGTTDTNAGTLHRTKNIDQKLRARSPRRATVRASNFLTSHVKRDDLQDLNVSHSF